MQNLTSGLTEMWFLGNKQYNFTIDSKSPLKRVLERPTMYRIEVVWDEKARVFIATSRDVPGLVLEDESYDLLVVRIKEAIRELNEQ